MRIVFAIHTNRRRIERAATAHAHAVKNIEFKVSENGTPPQIPIAVDLSMSKRCRIIEEEDHCIHQKSISTSGNS